VVHVTGQDLIEISFFLGSVDSETGVLQYMNIFAKDVLMDRYGIKRISQMWGIKRQFAEDDKNSWMFFLFSPAWVKFRATDAFYTYHPRNDNQFRMSLPGSTILYSLGGDIYHKKKKKKNKRTNIITGEAGDKV